MATTKKWLIAFLVMCFSQAAIANGTVIISSVDYVYLIKGDSVPTLVIVTSEEEIANLADKAAELPVLKARLKDTPITMSLRARENGQGLVGHLDGWGYGVLVLSKAHADKIY